MNAPSKANSKYALGIECSNPGACEHGSGEIGLARIVENGRLEFVGACALDDSARGSDGLMVAIDALCKQHAIGPGDLARIAVSIGPGGYTALRVSVTVAKVLATVAQCPVIGVPTASAALLGHADSVVALASKKGCAHCTQTKDGSLIELGVLDTQQLASCGAAVLVGDRHVPEEMVQSAKSAGMEIHDLVLSAERCLEASEGQIEQDPATLGVLYAREPDAVTQWRARHG